MTHIPYLPSSQPIHPCLPQSSPILFIPVQKLSKTFCPSLSDTRELSKYFCLHFLYRWKLFPVRWAHQSNPSIIGKDNNHTDMTWQHAKLLFNPLQLTLIPSILPCYITQITPYLTILQYRILSSPHFPYSSSPSSTCFLKRNPFPTADYSLTK